MRSDSDHSPSFRPTLLSVLPLRYLYSFIRPAAAGCRRSSRPFAKRLLDRTSTVSRRIWSVMSMTCVVRSNQRFRANRRLRMSSDLNDLSLEFDDSSPPRTLNEDLHLQLSCSVHINLRGIFTGLSGRSETQQLPWRTMLWKECLVL